MQINGFILVSVNYFATGNRIHQTLKNRKNKSATVSVFFKFHLRFCIGCGYVGVFQLRVNL